MKKVLTIGGATQDIFLHYEGADCLSITKKDTVLNYMLFESGEKIEVDEILNFTGGGATNSAVSFKRLGFDVSTFCQIGQDSSGKFILKDLKKEKINIENIIVNKKYSSGKSFVINSVKGERTIFAYRGANGYLTKSNLPVKAIKKSDLVYITSLSYGSANLLPDIVKLAKKNKKTLVAINPGISQLSKGTSKLIESLKNIDILILNSSEAKTFMQALIKVDKAYEKAFNLCKDFFSSNDFFKETLKMGPKIVVVTDGANGVYLATKEKILFHPSIKTKIANTLGAGDSFGSCFVASLALGYSIEQSLQNGIINSSSVISFVGAKTGLLTKEKLEKKIKDISKNESYVVEKISCLY